MKISKKISKVLMFLCLIGIVILTIMLDSTEAKNMYLELYVYSIIVLLISAIIAISQGLFKREFKFAVTCIVYVVLLFLYQMFYIGHMGLTPIFDNIILSSIAVTFYGVEIKRAK